MIYDWDTNKISVTDIYGTEFDIQLRGNITIIDGDSATGKTFLTSIIVDKQAGMEGNTNNPNKVLVFNYKSQDLASIFTAQHKLIIIDNANILIDERLRQHINADNSNRYLLLGRSLGGIEASINHYGELITTENNGKKIITVNYKYNLSGWS